MRISEVAAASGLTIDTIRFYEKSGLCPPIERGTDGKRSFTTENAEWFTLLASLRETGMPMNEMRHFATLYQRGDSSIPERKMVLLDHADRLQGRQRELQNCQDLLAFKLGRYDMIMSSET